MKSRIAVLDGFRALAILSVMFFHYFSRWTPPLNSISIYPYKNSYNFFRYGYLGVQFFFIISGFVIFFTLERTNYLVAFWKKRVIRLVPSIVCASIITFVIFRFFDKSFLFPNSHFAKNFFPSISFINPNILNNIFEKYNIDFHYINDSYWSLWVEIQFYLFSSIIYYLSKEKFLRNFLAATLFLILLDRLFHVNGNRIGFVMPQFLKNIYSVWIENGFNLLTYLPFFALGVLFYQLFKNNENKKKTPIVIKLYLGFFIFFIMAFLGKNLYERVGFTIMFLLFFTFLYKPFWIAIFGKKIISDVGESSYFLYLIHENIGILLIFILGQYFMPYGYVFPLLIITLFILFSVLFTTRLDKPINQRLRKMMP